MGNKSIDDILRSFGYVKDEEYCNCKFDSSGGAKDNWCKFFNLDVPFGFQDIDPMLLTIVGEIMSNILAGNMPTFVANAYGNWLQLISQVIVFFNSQKQYYESGPGRLYSKDYKNVSNPFLEKVSNDKTVKKKDKKYIDKLENIVFQLKNEIDELREEINKMKNE